MAAGGFLGLQSPSEKQAENTNKQKTEAAHFASKREESMVFDKKLDSDEGKDWVSTEA